MPRVVACHHCGAPHRLVQSQDRFSCDWCGGSNEVGRDHRPRELMVPHRPDPVRAVAVTERELTRREIRGARVEVEGQRWLGVWQALSDRGEEFTSPAQREVAGLDRSLTLPAVPLLPREECLEVAEGQALRPELEADEIVAAAQATYRERHSHVDELRLIWLPVVDLRVHTAAGPVAGIFVGGADRVVLAPVPGRASRVDISASRLQAFALFALTAIVLGASIANPWVRGVSEAVWFLVGWTAWSRVPAPRAESRP